MQWKRRWDLSRPPEDLDLTGLDISEDTLEKLLSVDKEVWKDEIQGIEEFYKQFDSLPKEITENFNRLKEQIM